jgi:hypothetical protein
MGKRRGMPPLGRTPPLTEMYQRQIWIVFASVIWSALSTFIFFSGPSFTIVNVIVGNICGTGATAACTIYDFWMPTFWFVELLIFAFGMFWSMGFFD